MLCNPHKPCVVLFLHAMYPYPNPINAFVSCIITPSDYLIVCDAVLGFLPQKT